jgi:ribonuclease P protein component
MRAGEKVAVVYRSESETRALKRSLRTVGLPKINRLHRRDFRAVYQRGLSRQSSHLKLKAIPAPSPIPNESTRDRTPLPPSQFGISLGRKVSKKAVERNRLKRQLRAAIRQLLPTLTPGWKTIIVVKPGAIECKYEHFLRELEELFSQAEAVDGHQRNHIL